MELLIMAAGMGSRFGGLKQIEPMGPNGEFIIDYSVYDAIKLGFSKIVFIIKEENYNIFKETIGCRCEKYIKTEYVFQKIDNIPSFVKVPEERVKPWGTAQAIYCAKDVINEPFVVINADDFYGRDAFLKAKEFILNKKNREYGIIGYEAYKTITSNGSVKRGVLEYDNNYDLLSIKESSIEISGNFLKCIPLNGTDTFAANLNVLVSMNMLVLDPSIFSYLEKKMNDFFNANQDNLNTCEFLIPDVLNDANKEGYAKVKVIPTKSKWYGVTYQEDKVIVQKAFNNLVKDGIYPSDLWK